MTDDFVAVIDGSTSKADIRYSVDVSNGRLCMLIVSDVIRNMSSESSVYEFCEMCSEMICKYYEEKPSVGSNNLMAASAIVFSAKRKEIWIVGDCQCLVDDTFYEFPKPEEKDNAEKRSKCIMQLLNEGRTTVDELRVWDLGRDAIKTELRECCKRQNLDYAVINGMNIPENLIHVISIADAKAVVLATDGYPYLEKTLEESESKLTDLIECDPLCCNVFKATKGVMKGYKSFDDRAYIRMEF